MIETLKTRVARLAPGIAVCVAVTLFAAGAEAAERRIIERASLESLLLANIDGTSVDAR